MIELRDEHGNLIASYDPMEFLPENHDVRHLIERLESEVATLRQQLQGTADAIVKALRDEARKYPMDSPPREWLLTASHIVQRDFGGSSSRV